MILNSTAGLIMYALSPRQVVPGFLSSTGMALVVLEVFEDLSLEDADIILYCKIFCIKGKKCCFIEVQFTKCR